MSEVARLAACSLSTVSLVLNETPGVRIADETRRRVQDAARAIGYRPPWPTLAGGDGSGRAIGFVVDRIATSPEAVVSIDAAREAAWANGVSMLVATTLADPEAERRAFEDLLARPVEGLVYATIMTREVVPPPLLRRVPAVLLNCHAAGGDLPSVVPAETGGGEAATAHLIGQGHRRIAHVTGELWMEAARDRLTGYRRALTRAGLAFDRALVQEGNWEYASGQRATHALMELAAPPTAIFFANDRMAVGGYAALLARRLRVPEDVSVVGYDDQPIAQELTPPLTSLVLPHREMGQWAVDWLLRRSARPRPQRFRSVRLPCPLVERGSVATPRTVLSNSAPS
ncbi:MAG: LacI family DNA-binding transcriptional regulator [Geminicoccaceae bacterium]